MDKVVYPNRMSKLFCYIIAWCLAQHMKDIDRWNKLYGS